MDQNNKPLPSAFGPVSRWIKVGEDLIPVYSSINWAREETTETEAQTTESEA